MIESDSKESLINFEGGAEKPKKETSPVLACLCPSKRAPADFPEAKSLRNFQLILFFLEIVYIFFDLFFYGSVYLALFEIPRCWMCYYNFVTLSRCMMNVFMFYIIIGGVFSVLSIFTIGLSSTVNMILFPC